MKQPALVATLAIFTASIGSSQRLLFQVDGSSPGDGFGETVVSLGDLDGDGVPDFAVNAARDSTTGVEQGSVSAYSGATQQLLYRVEAPTGFFRFGQPMARVDDLDGDSFPDLVVGSFSTTSFSHRRVDVLSGRTGASIRIVLSDSTGTNVPGFGTGLGSSGDVDGDGLGDFYAVAPGQVRVHSGGTGAFLYAVAGSDPNFGNGVISLSDQDGDGVADLAISDELADLGGTTRGRVIVVSGVNGAQIQQYEAGPPADFFGRFMANVGDIDADGFDDLAINFTRTSGRAVVWVVSGKSGSRLHTLFERSADDGFGQSMTGLGDVDRDGFADFAVGAPQRFGGSDDESAAYVFSGASGDELFAVRYPDVGRRVGQSLAAAGDLDGDGVPDLILGHPWLAAVAPPGLVSAIGIKVGNRGRIRL